LKIQSRDFSGFGYSTEDDVFRQQVLKIFKVLKIFALQTLTDFFIEEQRKISAVDLLTNLIKEETTSLILIGP
jgi:hypothetical protein